MPTPQLKPQWRLFERLLSRGALLRLIAAVAGLSLGYFLGGQTIKAAFYGLNWAGLAMFVLCGVLPGKFDRIL
ncbi:hypothetical protein MF271_19885 (plasmid) [Deinococcus sp. KNUC1210]|uniref:hypothetical protein n=1 Tax=Deinococcus sp. KNUC1210 TaxID=2917691 RepID=UPI001EEF9711|nr:hypothetical protein [Deinococcus sp. KNUC1210]ULH17675.1 hypothetical protein MF271_19885 [Deinococcus sp. KNUC1210]